MITVKPLTSAMVEVDLAGTQTMTFNNDEALDILEQLAEQAPGHVRVYRQGYGYTLNAELNRKALELAGLSSFQAAKQEAKGYIEF